MLLQLLVSMEHLGIVGSWFLQTGLHAFSRGPVILPVRHLDIVEDVRFGGSSCVLQDISVELQCKSLRGWDWWT